MRARTTSHWQEQSQEVACSPLFWAQLVHWQLKPQPAPHMESWALLQYAPI